MKTEISENIPTSLPPMGLQSLFKEMHSQMHKIEALSIEKIEKLEDRLQNSEAQKENLQREIEKLKGLLAAKERDYILYYNQYQNVAKENENLKAKLLHVDENFTAESVERDNNDVDNNSDSDINDYVEIFTPKRLDVEKDSNGLFGCTECDYKNKKRSQLERHYRRRHSDERPFRCKFCQKRFKTKDECVYHIRGHDDRFKLNCSVCGQKFMESHTILQHVEKLHNGKGYDRKKRCFKRKRSS